MVDAESNRTEPQSEGTIQFAYQLEPSEGCPLAPEAFAEFASWRSILFDLGLIGQDQRRYDGYGFGNMSLRFGTEQLVVTASQTSGQRNLSTDQLVHITAVNLKRFWVEARGLQPPSSETTTHAMLYAADPRIQAVIHVHSPEIWRQREALGLPATAPDVGYGSPEMSAAVAQTLTIHASRPLVFITQGHADGVFACGPTLRDAALLLISTLASSR